MEKLDFLNTKSEQKISLARFAHLFFSHLYFLILWSILLGGVGFALAKYAVKPVYTASSQVVVNQHSKNTQSFNDQQADVQMVNTYKSLVNSPSVLQEASYNLKQYHLSVSDLQNLVKAQTEQNSQVLIIKAVTYNPNESTAIANAVTNALKAKVNQKMHLDNIIIISRAHVPNGASFPNLLLFSLVGVVIGFLGSLIYLLIQEISSNIIYDREFVESKYNIPYLGSIGKPHYD